MQRLGRVGRDGLRRGGHAGGATGRHWVLDPIDGTKGFLRRDQYAIALALIDAGEVVAGVLGFPSLPLGPGADSPIGCLFVAARGAGASMRPLHGGPEHPIRVTALTDPAQACFCESVESAHSSHDDAARIASRLGVTQPPFRIDSQCKYGAVARGDASIYLRLPTRAGYEERVWDHAAGSIVVEEAGGRVSDIDGKPLDYSLGRTLKNNTGIVATNGLLHDRVIEAVRSVLGRD
jgi:3'(2'), 5'-bisphosphate nucleotidase